MKNMNPARPVPDRFKDAMEFAGSRVGEAVEFIGIFVSDLLHGAFRPPLVKFVLSWMGSIVKAIFSLFGSILKALFGIIGGLLRIRDLYSPVIGAVILIAGKTVDCLQCIFHLQAFERPLSDSEKDGLRRLFKNSLNYSVIRIVEGHTGLLGLNKRPFTLGNTIYVKRWKNTIELIVHESTHVWQNRYCGCRYTFDAIVAQWFVSDAYNWQKEISERKKEHWSDFNMEAQAAFIEHLCKGQTRGTTFESYADEALRSIRGKNSRIETV